MSYFDDYKDRLNAKGATVGEAYGNATIDLINRMFPNSPLYAVLPISGVNTEARILSNDTSSAKTLLFRPRTKLDKGSLVSLESSLWLITDFDHNEIYPKAVIAKCNEILKWKNKSGVVNQYDCVASGITSSFTFDLKEDKQMSLPTGELHIFVNYNADTMALILGTRFIIGSKVYKLAGIDDLTDVLNGKGVMRLYVKMDSVTDKDDFTNRIADNTNINGSAGTGGRLW